MTQKMLAALLLIVPMTAAGRAQPLNPYKIIMGSGPGMVASGSALAAEITRAQAAEAAAVQASRIGAALGVAPLDGTAKVPPVNLPSVTALSGYIDPTNAANVTVGKLVISVLPTGTGANQVAIGNDPRFSVPTITGGSIDGAGIGQVVPVPGVTSAFLKAGPRNITGGTPNAFFLSVGGEILGTWPSSAAPNVISINDQAAAGTAQYGFLDGMQVLHTLAGAAEGSRDTIRASFSIQGISPSDQSARQYSAVTGYAHVSVPVGGIAADYQQYAGGLFGGNDDVGFDIGAGPTAGKLATGWSVLQGREIDVTAQAGSTYEYERGVSIVHKLAHVVRGTYQSCAFCVGDQVGTNGGSASPGWAVVLEADGGTALAPDTTLIKVAQFLRPVLPRPTLGTVIDAGAAILTDQALLFPGFSVDPSGTVVPRQIASGALAAITIGAQGDYDPSDVITVSIAAPASGGQAALAAPDLFGMTSATLVSGGAGCSSGDVLSPIDLDGLGTITLGAVVGGVVQPGAFIISNTGQAADRLSNPRSVTGGTCTTEPVFNLHYGIERMHVSRPGWGYAAPPMVSVSAGTGGAAVAAAALVGTTVPVIGPMSVSGPLTAASIAVPAFTPASSSAACVAGTEAWDASFAYRCVSANHWTRSAMAAF